MKETGWISVHRSIFNHWVWQDKPFSKGQAWIDLILQANHTTGKTLIGKTLLEVERGSFVTSEVKLSKRWGWSRCKVRDFLKLLESDSMLNKQSDSKKTVIKVLNYDLYQNVQDDKSQQTMQPIVSKKTAESQQKDTNNNVNNDNKIISVNKKRKPKPQNEVFKNYAGEDTELLSALKGFEEMRNKIKKPLTDRARTSLLKKLDELSKDGTDKIALLDQSITRCWQTLYSLKEDADGHKTSAKNNSNKNTRTSYSVHGIQRL